MIEAGRKEVVYSIYIYIEQFFILIATLSNANSC